MSYEVLARKLRPSGFDALVGQDHVVRALRHALDQDRLHHAYLFTGTRGVGKTTIARILAKALNCETGVSSNPCEQCSVCREVSENRFMDLIEVDAASRTGVDDTRELLENAQYLPTRGRYKVYLIDEVHMLSIASFNALLKTLEEPPQHVKFLLATTDPKKVPATVLSRCLQFQLKNMSRETIVSYLANALQAEGVAADAGALQVIARHAAGSMRDALSLTDQAIAYGAGMLREEDVVAMLGVVGTEAVEDLLGALAAGNAHMLLERSAELAANNADFEDVLKSLIERLHAAAIADIVGPAPLADFSAEELQLYYQIALMGLRDISLAPEPRTGFEMTLLRMLAFTPNADDSVPRREPAQAAPPRDTVSTSTSTSTPPQTPPPVTAPTQELAALQQQWMALVEDSAPGGVTRMILDNAVLTELDIPGVTLLLDEQHDTLLSDAQQQLVARWLQEALGATVKLQISVGPLPVESPAQVRARVERERQAAAEQAIEQDARVADLVAEFGGRVEDVRPSL